MPDDPWKGLPHGYEGGNEGFITILLQDAAEKFSNKARCLGPQVTSLLTKDQIIDLVRRARHASNTIICPHFDSPEKLIDWWGTRIWDDQHPLPAGEVGPRFGYIPARTAGGGTNE